MSEIIKKSNEEYVLRDKKTKMFFKIFKFDNQKLTTVLDFTDDIEEAMKYKYIEQTKHPLIPLEQFDILKLKTKKEFKLIEINIDN